MRNVDKFKINTEAWTNEKLVQDFLLYRANLMATGPGNLCTPCTDKLVYPYAPYSDSNYWQRKRIGIDGAPWKTIHNVKPVKLIDPDPFMPSKYRENGYNCWDAAIGIAATASRSSKIIPPQHLMANKLCNTYWSQKLQPAINNVGPSLESDYVRRAEDTYIVDFTRIPNGWFYLEIAHALTHKELDNRYSNDKWHKERPETSHTFCKWVAKIAVAYAYGLPLCTNKAFYPKLQEADFPDVGLSVYVSKTYDNPVNSIPINKDEALLVDKTLAAVNVGIFSEPHPYGFITGTLDSTPQDRWCCMPTLAVISGWDTVENICHQPFVSRVPYGRTPVCYGIHPMDLMGPDLLWGYLQLWRMHRAAEQKPTLPDTNYTCVYLDSVLNTKMFEELYLYSPPLPCKYCMTWNYKTERKPERPDGRAPTAAKELKNKNMWMWRLYYRDVQAVEDIIERAVLRYETTLYKSRSAAERLRRKRKKNWLGRIQELKEAHYLENAKIKLRAGKPLTGWERKAVKKYRERQKDEQRTNTSD